MNIVIRTRNGFEQELREIDLISIEGKPYDQIIPPSLDNHEHRLQIIEEVLANLLNPPLSPQREQQASNFISPFPQPEMTDGR